MRIAKKLLALLLCLSMLMQFGITAYAADGETNLYADITATTAEVDDIITLTISNYEMTAQAIKAGFNFDNTKLEITKISWEDIVAYSEEEEDDVDNGPTSSTKRNKANETGTALGVYAINDGVDSLCYEGVIVTVKFKAIANGEAWITLREETGGTDAFKSDSVETITVTIGSSESSCDHVGTERTYINNADNSTHRVICEACGETIDEAAGCEETCNGARENEDGKTHTSNYICKHCAQFLREEVKAHYDEDEDGFCDACAYEGCKHASTKPESNGDDTHNIVCEDCHTVVTENEDCFGGTATCKEQAKCEVCDTAYGEYADHNYGTLIPAQDAVHSKDELKGAVAAHYICSECGKYFTEAKVETTLDELTGETPEHTVDPTKTKTETTKEPTCTEEGTEVTTTFCSCGYKLSEKTTSLGFAKHTWGTTTYTWSVDGKTYTAAHSCEAEGCEVSEEEVATIANGKVTSEVTTSATCNKKGTTTYTANFDAEWAEDGHTTTREDVPATGEHSFTTKASDQQATAADCDNAATYYVQCDNCDAVDTTKTVAVGTANGHAFNTKASDQQATAADCDNAATYYVQCDNCDAVDTTKTVAVGTANGHSYTKNLPGTLKTAGTCVAEAVYAAKCDNCDYESDTLTVNGEKDLTNHTAENLTYKKITDFVHDVLCECGEVYQSAQLHDYNNAEHKCVCGDVEKITIIVQYPAKAPNALKQEFITAPYGTTVNLTPAPEAIGHTFTGFRNLHTYEMVATAEDNYAYTITEHEVTLQADYVANDYKITWDLGGGKLVEDGIELPATVKYDLPIKVLTSNNLTDGKFVEREGHTFSHFEDKAGNRYDVNKDGMTNEGITWKLGNMPAGDLELTAVWTVNEYTLHIVRIRGGELATIEVPYGTKILDIINEYKIESESVNETDQIGVYEFLGWDDGWNIIDAEYTMPAKYLVVYHHQTFTGWTKRTIANGWVYQVKNLTQKGWTQIDGEWYYLNPNNNGVRTEGVTRVPYPTEAINGITYGPNAEDKAYWEAHKDTSMYSDAETAIFIFDENGKFQQTTGIVGNRYAANGMIGWHPGMVEVDGECYYFIGDKNGGGNIAANGDTNVTRPNGYNDFKSGDVYNFDNGKLSGAHGVVDGKYYENSKLMRGNGLTKVGDKYIYVRSSGELVVGTSHWVPANSLKIVAGMYEFDADGYMINPVSTEKNGIVEEDGALYYYENGKRCYAGLIEIDGDMYYIRSNGQVATGEYYVTKSNVDTTDIAPGTKLIFDEDGKMMPIKNGIVAEEKGLFYYQNNKLMKGAGLVKIGDDMYYILSNGQVATGEYYVTKVNNTGIDKGTKLVFGEDGKMEPMKNGIVAEEKGLFYYKNNKLMKGAGVVELTDENGVTFYIYVRSNGQLATGTYWPSTRNGLLPRGAYNWGTNGRYYPG